MDMPSRAGWYDDPDNPQQLRYFDGIIWTSHTTPRSTRSAAPVATAPGTVPPAGASATGAPGYAAPPTAQPPAGPAGWSAPTPPGAPNPQFPGAPQQGQWNLPPQGAYSAPQGPTTPDGVPLASYGQRVGAFILDLIITSVIGGVLSMPYQLRVSGSLEGAMDDFANGGDFATLFDAAMKASQENLVPLTLIALGSSFIYHVVFVALLSATPGKLALGISIRRREAPGRVGWTVAVRRRLLQTALGLLRMVALLELVYLLGSALNLLWPSWDAKRQALHDKIAGTNVVVGRQTKA